MGGRTEFLNMDSTQIYVGYGNTSVWGLGYQVQCELRAASFESRLHYIYIPQGLNHYQHCFEHHKLYKETNLLFEIYSPLFCFNFELRPYVHIEVFFVAWLGIILQVVLLFLPVYSFCFCFMHKFEVPLVYFVVH